MPTIFIKLNLSLLFFLSIQVFADSADSLIRLQDMSFNFEWEKRAFIQTGETNPNQLVYLKLLFAGHPDANETNIATFDKKVTAFVSEIAPNVTSSKTPSKKIELIHKKVHQAFLTKYELKNQFYDLAKTGMYNCVSGTALFALVLEKLNIPYVIKEYPTHVNLIAYPDDHKLLIETTDPSKGYFKISDPLMAKYVQYLLKSKQISQSEFDSKKTEDLFNDHFFSQAGNLKLKQLIGIQFMNNCIYLIEDKKPRESYVNMQKAYWLHPSPKNSFMLKESLTRVISDGNYADTTVLQGLFTYVKSFQNIFSETDKNEILGEFNRITEVQLIQQSNFDKYKLTFNKLSQLLDSSDLQDRLHSFYCFELNKTILNAGVSRPIDLECLQKSYNKSPNNADLRSLILFACSKYCSRSSKAIQVYDITKTYAAKFPFLNENPDFIMIKAASLLEMIYFSFNKGEGKKGDIYVAEANQLLSGNSVKIDEITIEKAYVSAVAFYFKNNNLTRAKQLLNQALVLAPENETLLELKKSVR